MARSGSFEIQSPAAQESSVLPIFDEVRPGRPPLPFFVTEIQKRLSMFDGGMTRPPTNFVNSGSDASQEYMKHNFTRCSRKAKQSSTQTGRNEPKAEWFASPPLKPPFWPLPSRLADAPSVAILDPVPTVQERGLARHGQFNTGNNFKRICVCRGEGGQ
jgi:hypothetical protein